MSKMSNLDIMLEQMERDAFEDSAYASNAMEGIYSENTRMTASYTFDEVLQMFGNNLAMFGELIVGTPACEYAWERGDLDVEANNISFMPGEHGRDRILFTRLDIAKPRRWDDPDINEDLARWEKEILDWIEQAEED